MTTILADGFTAFFARLANDERKQGRPGEGPSTDSTCIPALPGIQAGSRRKQKLPAGGEAAVSLLLLWKGA
jgi:hypothetical protein